MKIDCKILLIENVTEVELKQTNKHSQSQWYFVALYCQQ